MKIRLLKSKDLPEVTILFDDYRIFYGKTTDLLGSEKFLSERLERNESVIYIAEDPQNKIVGFMQLYPLFSSTKLSRLWLLNDLFVTHSYRGQGVSKLLIEEAKIFCINTNASGILLETAKSNTIGNSLYLKTGFSLDQDHNYYLWNNL